MSALNSITHLNNPPAFRHTHSVKEKKLQVRLDNGKRRFRDNLLLTRDGTILLVTEINDDFFKGFPYILEAFDTTDMGLPLPWELVGVHTNCGGIDYTSPMTINRSQVIGKAVLHDKFLITMHTQWFMSKYDY